MSKKDDVGDVLDILEGAGYEVVEGAEKVKRAIAEAALPMKPAARKGK